jgi:hypothetical protein
MSFLEMSFIEVCSSFETSSKEVCSSLETSVRENALSWKIASLKSAYPKNCEPEKYTV